MTITHWPREDRPREKLLSKGEQALTDAELIAILLKEGTKGKTALDIARELLHEFGALRSLLHSPPAALFKKSGIGPAKYAVLKAATELGRRYQHQPLPEKVVLNNPRLSQQFLAKHLSQHENEVFACLFLDNHFRLIRYEELFKGTINEANVHIREIVKKGLAHNAAKIILAHNHPSGISTPSHADREITRLIKHALNYVDIEVADHIIIGNPDHFSFAEAGIL